MIPHSEPRIPNYCLTNISLASTTSTSPPSRRALPRITTVSSAFRLNSWRASTGSTLASGPVKFTTATESLLSPARRAQKGQSCWCSPASAVCLANSAAVAVSTTKKLACRGRQGNSGSVSVSGFGIPPTTPTSVTSTPSAASFTDSRTASTPWASAGSSVSSRSERSLATSASGSSAGPGLQLVSSKQRAVSGRQRVNRSIFSIPSKSFEPRPLGGVLKLFSPPHQDSAIAGEIPCRRVFSTGFARSHEPTPSVFEVPP
jgi:hypothetical protein